MKQESAIIVMDMDEVLVNISPKSYHLMRMNWPTFSPFLKDLGHLSDKEVLSRPHFQLTEWLVKDELKDNLTAKAYLWTEQVDRIFNTDLYSDLQPTEFAISTIMNKAYMDSPAIKKVIILSRNVQGGHKQEKSKKEFIERYFTHPKIETIMFETGTKGEIIRDRNINFSLFIDDEPNNILSVIKEVNVEHKEFLMPKLGYNDLAKETLKIIENKNAVLSTFIPKEIM